MIRIRWPLEYLQIYLKKNIQNVQKKKIMVGTLKIIFSIGNSAPIYIWRYSIVFVLRKVNLFIYSSLLNYVDQIIMIMNRWTIKCFPVQTRRQNAIKIIPKPSVHVASWLTRRSWWTVIFRIISVLIYPRMEPFFLTSQPIPSPRCWNVI